MTVLQITCDNCGAKYKLPETFKGAQAKCQKCGSVIDVQKQRAAAAGAASPSAAAKPASEAARPAAAAKPAVDRSKAAPKSEARPAARPAPSTRLARKDKAADDGAEGGARPGRGERPKKKDSTMPILLAGVGLLVIAGVAFLLLSGGEPAKKTTEQAASEPAKAAAAAAPAAATPPTAQAPQPAVEAPKAETPKAEAPKAEEPKPAAAEAPKAEAPAAPAAPATPEDPARPKRPWEKLKNPPASLDQVTDPKSYGDVPWPTTLDDARKTELRGLAEDAAGDGIRSTRAKNKLQEVGWAGLFAVVEQLQKLDYRQAEQAMVGFDLNKLLETITGGQNMRYEPVDAGETIPPAKAEWNTNTVRAWIQVAGQSVDEEAFNKARAERLKKASGDK